jgi:hypothetical protein
MVFQPATSIALDLNPPRSNAWSVMPLRGATPLGRHVSMPMALTQPAPHGGGVVMVYPELTGVTELATAIRHELGHVLGLMHDPASRLMSPVHDPAAQLCIDKATMVAVARLRGLPIAELNWCEEGETPA